jgi:hypothetical protein
LAGALAYGAHSSNQARKDAKKAQKKQEQILEQAKPDAPIGVGAPGETDIRRKAIKAGRAGTLRTGSLVPQNIGKRRLLGGAR